MNLPQTGGCQCGKVRYEITQQPLLVYTELSGNLGDDV